jgi:HD-GYP domain-containing protein (c-di-GMP phosphodiesterase class II)
MPNLASTLAKGDSVKAGILDKIWTKMKPEAKKEELITAIVSLTHHTLNGSASSLLILEDTGPELYFQFSEALAGQKYKKLDSDRQSSIADWIIKNGKPIVINDRQKARRYYRHVEKATGFKTEAILGAPIIIEGKVIGVIEVLNKLDGILFSQKDMRTLMSLASTTAASIVTSRMNVNLMNSYKSTVKALVSLADTKESSGGGHSRRVMEYSLLGAAELSLSREEKHTIEYAAMLHDIGKLSIPDSILNKAGPLTDEEWEKIKRHPLVGYNLLKDIPFLKEASKLILYHHERFDGKGYPRGVEGGLVPIGGRLIAVADAFDIMTTNHAYRKAIGLKEAFAELHKNAGSQFCPDAVKAFNAGYVRARLKNK